MKAVKSFETGSGRLPPVSVVVPTLNAERFLTERIRSLRQVEYGPLEFLCVDSGSTDGTRTQLLAWAREDVRVRLIDAPRGLYRSLNVAVREAKGVYVYIATADDTCEPDIFRQMVPLLEAHPECDICDSRLTEIDEDGRPLREGDALFLPVFGHLRYPRDVAHVRSVPHDFILHCSGKTVYTSLTQILIRKAAFDKSGPFPEDWGPSGDYLWGMRVASACNVVYTPLLLATWRVHASQLTGRDKASRNFELMQRMGRLAIDGLPEGEFRQTAEGIHRITDLMSDLLPLKRRAPFGQIAAGLVRCVARHPLWMVEWLALYAWNKVAGRGRSAAGAYDALFLHVAGKCLDDGWIKRIGG